MDVPGGVVQGAAALALVLAAAKAHGRQLRLERTQAGHPHADFRGPNDPWVEALWRRDRVRFWSLFAVLAPLGILAAALMAPPPLAWAVAVNLALAFAGCFAAMGVWSLWRLAETDADGWRSGAIGTSFLWWTLVALLFGLAAGLGR